MREPVAPPAAAPIEVLLLSRYPESGPSSRYRFYQFFEGLRAAGVNVHPEPLVGDSYIDDLYGGRSPKRLGRLVAATAARLWTLLRARRYDAVWIGGELFPFAPALVERVLEKAGFPYVVDYDDALFHRYDRHGSAAVRALLGRKIDAVMAHAGIVVTGNEYLADRARAAGARQVVVVPTVIDLARYPSDPPRPPDRFRVGWIGSPVTETYLHEVAAALRQLFQREDGELVAIGVRPDFALEGVPVRRVEWSGATEVQELRSCSVGIMPLPDDPWSNGKCGFKLIQYMGAHLPVVASPVGANRQIVLDGQTGFLASTAEEWVRALETLHADPSLRRRMGEAGRQRALQHYSVQAVLPRLEHVLRSAAEQQRVTHP